MHAVKRMSEQAGQKRECDDVSPEAGISLAAVIFSSIFWSISAIPFGFVLGAFALSAVLCGIGRLKRTFARLLSSGSTIEKEGDMPDLKFVLKNYLLSNANLAGCGAAAAIVGLYLVGIIASFWFPLAIVAYGLGVAALWNQEPSVPKPLAEGLDTQAYLDWLREKVLPLLPPEAAGSLKRILDMATEIWPRIKEMQDQGLVQVENRTMLKQTLTKFLPDIAQNYLKLPSVYAKTHKVDGKTPMLLLTEQMNLLEVHVTKIREGVYAHDVDALLANGKFLQEKFSPGLLDT